MSEVEMLSTVWDGLTTYLGTPWIAFVLLFIGVVALFSVVLRVNALISIYLATVPFFVVLLYNASLGNTVAVAAAIVIIGFLFGISVFKIQNNS